MNKLDMLVERLVDEFGGEPWHWYHLANCDECYFYDDGGVCWCWRIEGRLHRYPQTYDDWIKEAYGDHARWISNRMFRSIYEPIIQRQLAQEVTIFKSLSKPVD
jgi:hypothetical protein